MPDQIFQMSEAYTRLLPDIADEIDPQELDQIHLGGDARMGTTQAQQAIVDLRLDSTGKLPEIKSANYMNACTEKVNSKIEQVMFSFELDYSLTIKGVLCLVHL